jgi:hypothetical protein
MPAELSTRRYPAGLDPVSTGVASTASGTSKSAISRRFVDRTKHALAELLHSSTGSSLLVGKEGSTMNQSQPTRSLVTR